MKCVFSVDEIKENTVQTYYRLLSHENTCKLQEKLDETLNHLKFNNKM